MYLQVTDQQYLEYAARLSRTYLECTSLEDYKKLLPSFELVRKQTTSLHRSCILKSLLADRAASISKLKDLYAIKSN